MSEENKQQNTEAMQYDTVLSVVHALKFAKWMDYNAIRAGEDTWTYRDDFYKKKRTTKELFDIFIKYNR
jgi:hypothetical protein